MELDLEKIKKSRLVKVFSTEEMEILDKLFISTKEIERFERRFTEFQVDKSVTRDRVLNTIVKDYKNNIEYTKITLGILPRKASNYISNRNKYIQEALYNFGFHGNEISLKYYSDLKNIPLNHNVEYRGILYLIAHTCRKFIEKYIPQEVVEALNIDIDKINVFTEETSMYKPPILGMRLYFRS